MIGQGSTKLTWVRLPSLTKQLNAAHALQECNMPKVLRFKQSTSHIKHGNHSQVVNKLNGNFQNITIDSTQPHMMI